MTTEQRDLLWQQVKPPPPTDRKPSCQEHAWRRPRHRDLPPAVRALAATAPEETVWALHHHDWLFWLPFANVMRLVQTRYHDGVRRSEFSFNFDRRWALPKVLSSPLRIEFANNADCSVAMQWTPIDPWRPMPIKDGPPLRWAYLQRSKRSVFNQCARGNAVLYLSFDTRREATRLRHILRSRRRDPRSLFSLLPKEIVDAMLDFV